MNRPEYMTPAVENEIVLKEDECCIVFDLACYFPYKGGENLEFEFALGDKLHNDIKLNHRFPNKAFYTISKKTGRKVSKLGYPVIMKLDEQGGDPTFLVLKIKLKETPEQAEQQMTALFAITTHMTKENPVCGLSLIFSFEDGAFNLHSWDVKPREGEDNIDISLKLWSTMRFEEEEKANIKYFDMILSGSDENTIIADTIIDIPACKPRHLIMQ